jgi:hypothetical protein
MIAALGLEIAAIRTRGGGQQLALRGGEQVGRTGDAWLYRFAAADDLQLRDETPVRVAVDQLDVNGVLVSFRDGVLVVALEKDIGPRIAAARVIANDVFLVERLKERLAKVENGEVPFHRPAAERALGLAAPRTAEGDPHAAVLADGRANADQVQAVRRSLGSDTTFVWGPPGTGKTSTLARIVEAHFRAGRSVLLVSNTNIAVDTALERVAERLQGEPDFHHGLVIRHGPVVKAELRQRFGAQVILERVVARLSEALAAEKQSFQREASLLEVEEGSLLAALEVFEQLAEASATLAACGKARDLAMADVTARERLAEQLRAEAAGHRADLGRARGMGPIRRFFSGLHPARLERKAAAAERAERAAADAARSRAAELPKHEAKLTHLRARRDQLAAKARSCPSTSEIDGRLAALRAHLGGLRERTMAIDRELGEIEPRLLARCRVLATTAYRAYLRKDAARLFDAAVIDEASMLMPPLVYHAAGLATRSVTVAGDFRQLPPIVTSDEPLAAEWLRQDVFELAGIPGRLARQESLPHLVALRTQYRMREPICEVVSALFYADHPLRSDPSIERDTRGFPLSDAPLLYVDTSAFHPWTALRIGTYSRYNPFHALLVRNIVLHLAETGFLPAAGEANAAVGVVTPYAAQARLIQALLDDRLGDRAAGIAATVHRFQGNEKRVMILDLTDSLGARLGRFMQATRPEEDGARLLNVAASRARHHLVLVGNFDYLRRSAPRDGFTRRLVDHFEEHGTPLGLDALLPLADREWVDGLHRMLPARFTLPDGVAGAFTEGTFYPAFLDDLARVRESAVIFSPYATRRGTSRWADVLRAALARGVRVRLLTRPPSESAGSGADELAELLRALRELGVTVDLRARMHEKIAILDGRVLWHGSLNILSHRDTHESMLRLDSPAACAQLAQFVTTPANRRAAAPLLDAQENPPCPQCAGPTVWNSGPDGVHFECESASCGRVDARRRVRTQQPGGARRAGSPGGPAGRPCPRPGCDGRLVERHGPYGRFLGCTRFPDCRHIEKPN